MIIYTNKNIHFGSNTLKHLDPGKTSRLPWQQLMGILNKITLLTSQVFIIISIKVVQYQRIALNATYVNAEG